MTRGAIREKAREVTSGRAMAQGSMEAGEETVEPRVEMTEERMNPTLMGEGSRQRKFSNTQDWTSTHTSSNTAAPARMVPSRVVSNPADASGSPSLDCAPSTLAGSGSPPTALRTTKVVPSEVLDRLAPAANASSGSYPSGTSTNERAMGAAIPVRAISVAKGRDRRSVLSGVVSPPTS